MSEDPAFKFSQNIKSKLDPAVYETRYDEDAQEMTVYVADRDRYWKRARSWIWEPSQWIPRKM